MPKSIPTLGLANWGQPLNDHLSQLNSPTTGGINTVNTTAQRPSTLTINDTGFTAINKATGNLHQWTGSTWNVLNESVINLKDFGAIGDNTADDGPALQAAIDFCITNGHSTLFIPDGDYKYTVSPTIPTDKYLSIRGNSRKAILHPNGCHGIIINNNNTEAPQCIFSNFTILGYGTDNFAGIHAPGTLQTIGDPTSGGGLARVCGYTFEHLEIYYFGVGIHIGYGNIIRIHNNNILQCYHGIFIRGQIIWCQIQGNYIGTGPYQGAIPTTINGMLPSMIGVGFGVFPSNMRIGVFIGGRDYSSGYTRTESAHIHGNLIFGYDNAISYYDCLYGVITDNDCDNSLQVGIYFNQSDGGLRIENNWIGANSNATATIGGIVSTGTGYTTNTAKVIIRGNTVISYGTVPSPFRGANGISVIPEFYDYCEIKSNNIGCDYFINGIFVEQTEGAYICDNILWGPLAGGGEYINIQNTSNARIIDNKTLNNKLPKIVNGYSTIGRYFLNGIGAVEQFGNRFSFFDGIYTREWKGVNDGDFQTNPNLYSIQSGPAGLPTSPTGLPAGSKWVDTANGNVIKQV
jgi:hypothetical protein